MYNSIRWIIFFVIIGCTALLIRKITLKNSKIIKTIVLIVVAITVFIFWDIPFENCLLSFKTIQKSFNYYSMQSNVEVFETFEGETSGILLYKCDNGYSNYIASKTEKGWKIGNSNTIQIECQKSIGRYNIVVYKVKETQDIYVWINISFVNDVAEITDSKGEQFEYIQDGNHVMYYRAYYDDSFDYKVIIDNETYSLK